MTRTISLRSPLQYHTYSRFTWWLRMSGKQHLVTGEEPDCLYNCMAKLQRSGASEKEVKDLWKAWDKWQSIRAPRK